MIDKSSSINSIISIIRCPPLPFLLFLYSISVAASFLDNCTYDEADAEEDNDRDDDTPHQAELATFTRVWASNVAFGITLNSLFSE